MDFGKFLNTKSFVLLFLLFLSSAFCNESMVYAKSKREWKRCKRDKDCIVMNMCNGYAINEKYVYDASSYYVDEIKSKNLACDYSSLPENKYHAVCEHFYCQLKRIVEEKSKEKWFKCSKNEDCVAAQSECGLKAVNRKYKNDAENFFAHNMLHIDANCVLLSEKFEISCQKSKCEGKYIYPEK